MTTTTGVASDIKIYNTAGTAADAIEIVTGAGGITVTTTGATAGDMLMTIGDDLLIDSAGAVDITTATASTEGDITLDAEAASIILDSGQDIADAITLVCTSGDGGIDITSLGDIDITTTGAADQDISITNTGGSINVVATEDNAGAILIEADGGASSAIKIYNDTGTSSTANAASIQLSSDLGAINLVATGNVAVAAGASAVQLTATLGGVELNSGLNAEKAIKLSAVGGVNADIDLWNDTGNTADSIHLLSDDGGITLTAGTAIAATSVTGSAHTASAVADGGKGFVMSGTPVGDTYSEGIGLYVEGNIGSDQDVDGKAYAFGSWLNITGTCIPTDGEDSILSAADIGIWAASAPTLTASKLRVLNIEYQVDSGVGTPEETTMMHFNSGSTDNPDYFFTTGNANSVVYSANTTHTSPNKAGAIKVKIGGVGDRYIWLFSDAGS